MDEGWADDDDDDDRPVRRADEVIRLLFQQLADGLRGRRLERLRDAEADLRRCLESSARRVLIDPELELLELELQFGHAGAPTRVASADVVLLVLPTFLDDPLWHGADLEDRRLRIRLVPDLVRRAVRLPELEAYRSSCAVWDIEAAVERARFRLRVAREAARP